MHKLIFATTNDTKFRVAQSAASDYSIKLSRQPIEIDEIQSEYPEKIARDKAGKAFDILKQPVLITDDSWAFLGLNGFPGPYMHSINEWLSAEDLLRLTLPLKDRRAILTQTLIYQDSSQQKIFTAQIKGMVLKEARGSSPAHPNHTIVTMSGDNGLSLAEVYESRQPLKKDRQVSEIWREFFEWFAKEAS